MKCSRLVICLFVKFCVFGEPSLLSDQIQPINKFIVPAKTNASHETKLRFLLVVILCICCAHSLCSL